jgi:hypothetical protein
LASQASRPAPSPAVLDNLIACGQLPPVAPAPALQPAASGGGAKRSAAAASSAAEAAAAADSFLDRVARMTYASPPKARKRVIDCAARFGSRFRKRALIILRDKANKTVGDMRTALHASLLHWINTDPRAHSSCGDFCPFAEARRLRELIEEARKAAGAPASSAGAAGSDADAVNVSIAQAQAVIEQLLGDFRVVREPDFIRFILVQCEAFMSRCFREEFVKAGGPRDVKTNSNEGWFGAISRAIMKSIMFWKSYQTRYDMVLLTLSEGESSWLLEFFERFNIPVPPGDRLRLTSTARRDKERRARTHTEAHHIATSKRRKAKVAFIQKNNRTGSDAYSRAQALKKKWIDDNTVDWGTVSADKQALLEKVLYQQAWHEVRSKTDSTADGADSAYVEAIN